MKRRICVVTAGHPSTSPRMLKAADAFVEAGYDVRLASTRHSAWAWRSDQEVRKSRSWDWTVVDYDRKSNWPTYFWSGVRYQSSRRLARLFKPANCPTPIVARAFGRAYSELLHAAAAEPADFIYGGTTGGLAVTAAAARRLKIPYALDLEDFHSGEREAGPEADFTHALAERIERATLFNAAFLTAGSQGIANSYHAKYGVRPIPINNVFSLNAAAPLFNAIDERGLRLYWFSQTIGPGRGLEDAISAMGMIGAAGELHIRGSRIGWYWNSLLQQTACKAPKLRLFYHEPAAADQMIELARGYDVGLGLEAGRSLNNAQSLSNKAFTYMLAGLALALTNTPGQRPLADDLDGAAVVVQPGDPQSLASGLRRWTEDADSLAAAKHASWNAAGRRWHWEHPEERGALLAAVAQVWQ